MDISMIKTFLVMAIIILTSAKVGAQDFYVQLNEYRKSHFLRALEIDTMLEKEASARVDKINTVYRGALRHGNVKPPKGHKFKSEVLAKGDEDLEGWLRHVPHRKIILNRKARKIGFIRKGEIACARLSD